MTDLQKKIQKSSSFAAGAFYLITMYPVGHLLFQFVTLYYLLTDSNSSFRLADGVSTTTAVIQLLCNSIVYLMASAAVIMAQRIFREISKEYTPFKPLHVKRLKRITVLSLLCLIGDSLLNTWSARLLNPVNRSFLSQFLHDLNYTNFLLPVVICCCTFILDYACQLQAEADTTL